ncbi:MAG: TrmB family transcriptional regulator [Candidatus Aenigmarchaeota archaeon]|nr:TrmB family transcriptional regulator [Candidatus Aenigmarchaeota archaeon]
MISQETLDALKNIGLNLYERKLYAALIARGTSNVGELSELASVPRSRAYDVLESLGEKGFVIIKHAKPMQYVAVDPIEAIEKSKQILKDNFNRTVTRMSVFSTSDSMKELSSLYTSGLSLVDPSELSGSFKGNYSMNLHVNSMIKGAQNTVDIMTTESGVKTLVDKHSNILQKAKKNGIKLRVAAPVTSLNKDETKMLSELADFKDLNSSGKKLPMGRMMIVDGKQVMFGLTDDSKTHESQDTAFWSASDHFSENFAQTMFEMIWGHLK